MTPPQKLPALTNKQQWEEFKASAQRHQVSSLYHCTASANLPSIIRAGGILSRREQERLGIIPDHYHGWGKKWSELSDYVCLAFFPPRHIREESDSQALLRIALSPLWKQGAVFSPCNSAKEWFSAQEIRARDDLASFEDLFRHEHGAALKRSDAEVLIPGKIPLKWIQAILFVDETVRRQTRRACIKKNLMRFATCPQLASRFQIGVK